MSDAGRPEGTGIPVQNRVAQWAARVWYAFADVSTLLWTVGLAFVGVLAAAALADPSVRAGVESAATANPVVGRIYEFFELHNPLASWWVGLLVVGAALALVATLAENHGRLALRLSRDRSAPTPHHDLPVWAARRAAEKLGEGAVVGVGEETAAASLPAPLTRIGLAVVALGALLLLGAVPLQRHRGVAGELLLRQNEDVDRVQVPGPLGTPGTRPLGFTVRALEVAPGGARARIQVTRNGGATEEIEVAPTQPARIGSTRLIPRTNRLANGGEEFRVRVTDARTDQNIETRVPPRTPIVSPDGKTTYRINSFTYDFRSLGPAVEVQRLEGETVAETFWVFQSSPDFDARNREDPNGMQLLGIERQSELIVAAVRHPGVPFAAFGCGLLLVGLVLSVAAARKTPVVCAVRGRVVGAPESDPRVKAALEAAVGEPGG